MALNIQKDEEKEFTQAQSFTEAFRGNALVRLNCVNTYKNYMAKALYRERKVL